MTLAEKQNLYLIGLTCVLAIHIITDHIEKKYIDNELKHLYVTDSLQIRLDSIIYDKMSKIVKATNDNHKSIKLLQNKK
jgi:hypothetical protein